MNGVSSEGNSYKVIVDLRDSQGKSYTYSAKKLNETQFNEINGILKGTIKFTESQVSDLQHKHNNLQASMELWEQNSVGFLKMPCSVF